MANDKWTTQQKIGAALLGASALAGIGVAIAQAFKPEKKSRASTLFGAEPFGSRKRLGAKVCKPCGG